MSLWIYVIIVCILGMAVIEKQVIPVPRRWAIAGPIAAVVVAVAWLITSLTQQDWSMAGIAVLAIISFGLVTWYLAGVNVERSRHAGERPVGPDNHDESMGA